MDMSFTYKGFVVKIIMQIRKELMDAVLDETDSGLDVDALRTVATGVNSAKGDENGIFIITHYTRILEYIVPDQVTILIDGKVVATGGKDLAERIEKNGYDTVLKKEKALSA